MEFPLGYDCIIKQLPEVSSKELLSSRLSFRIPLTFVLIVTVTLIQAQLSGKNELTRAVFEYHQT